MFEIKQVLVFGLLFRLSVCSLLLGLLFDSTGIFGTIFYAENAEFAEK